MWSMSNAHSIINQMTSAFKRILMLFWRYLNLKFEQRHTMIHTWFYGYFLDFGQREIWPVDGFLFHFLFLTVFLLFSFSFCFGLLITTYKLDNCFVKIPWQKQKLWMTNIFVFHKLNLNDVSKFNRMNTFRNWSRKLLTKKIPVTTDLISDKRPMKISPY